VNYLYTSQRAVVRAFWQAHPDLPRRRIRDYVGTGLMHVTDVRVAFVDFIDALERNGDISAELAQRVTLD
jgi:hypothetical protein